MAADAIPLWVAVGYLLFFGYSVISAFALARRGVRGGGKAKIEVTLLPPTCRLSVAGADPAEKHVHGEGLNAAREPFATESPLETMGRRDEDSMNQAFREQ